MKDKLNAVKGILQGCPTETLFATLAKVWKHECPQEPSLALMREMASAGQVFMQRVASKGPHQEHPQHRLISNVATMATAPCRDSGAMHNPHMCISNVACAFVQGRFLNTSDMWTQDGHARRL